MTAFKIIDTQNADRHSGFISQRDLERGKGKENGQIERVIR